MEGIFIISAIISLILSYFIIYSAVKNALSSELKKTNELLEKVLKQNNFEIDSFQELETKPVVENINSIFPNDKNVMKYYTLRGDHLHVYSDLKSGYQNGDLAFIGDIPAKDGKYKLSLFDSIVVENGKVVK